MSVETLLADCKSYIDSKITGKFAEKLKIDFDIDKIYSELQKEEIENSSSFRFDIAVKPQLNFEFGMRNRNISNQHCAGTKNKLVERNEFNYELIVPLVNEFGTRGDSVDRVLLH